ncbi:Oxidation resistance protein 1 [Oryzias melastigma]|uniref:Oxidation resistance protein 1 n=1 Tax=Oryzias melastigma TaxID=30732 RepID=A0A834BUU4_ORYME|nr:Oxidation resistance protein 1 [Oryzias melastigma]
MDTRGNHVSYLCLLSAPYRLKQKSQSVDIASQGFSPKLVPASPQNKAAPPVAKTTTGLVVQENNTTNSQLRNPRCGELKRGYTIVGPLTVDRGERDVSKAIHWLSVA